MTGRERILAALKGEETDRMPWAPLIDDYFISSLPKQGYQMDILTAMRHIGCDIMERHVGGPNVHYHKCELKAEQNGKYSKVTIETPVGSIYEEKEVTPSTIFITHHLIETVEDVKVMQFVMENLEYTPNIAAFVERDRQIGDNGIATPSMALAPIQALLQLYSGIENTVFLLADYPNEVETLFAIMHERNKDQCKVFCEYPTPVVIQYEDTSTTVMNKAMLMDYEIPCINEYAKIYRAAGIKYITHMCGKLNGFKEEIGAADMDGIDSVCPPTTGDLACWDAREAFGDKIIVGGIEPPSLVRMNVRETLDYVAEIIRKLKNKRGFILSTGDATPHGTPIENLTAISRLLTKLGKASLGCDVPEVLLAEIASEF